jgi:hypothetical protein
MRSLLAISLVLVAGSGCAQYAYNTAGLVPRATVPTRSGSPLGAPGAFTAGASNVGDVRAPELADQDAAVEVPTTQLRGDLRVRLGRITDLGLVYERGLAAGARKLDPTAPDVKGGDVSGWGITVGVAIPTGDPRWHIGLRIETTLWNAPYVEYETCLENCPTPGATQVQRGRDAALTQGIGVTPSFRSGALTLFGGAFARNQPTVTQKEIGAYGGDRIESGPFNLLVHAGVEIALGHGIKGILIAHQDLTAAPVRFGPGLAAAIQLPLGTPDPAP